MSKTVKNTHRRQMRTVTPAVRAGRVAAGAALAAGMLFTGGSVATAETGTSEAAGQNDATAGTVITPAAAPAVNLPDVAAPKGKKDKKKAEPALAPAAGALTVSLPEPEPEPVVEDTADASAQDGTSEASTSSTQHRSDDSQSSRSGERSAQSQSSSSEQQDSSSQQQDSSSEAGGISPSKGESILATARSGIGVPYVLGGTGTSGWDCSGFTAWVYAQHGISLPHNDGAQAAVGKRIPRSEARPGDLIRKPGHVGIYAGGNKMVDAGNRRVGTSERNIYSGDWSFYRVG